VRRTRQRVAAADNSAHSHDGLASNPRARPRSAASCRRRDSAIFSFDPSAMTTLVAGERSDRSMAQRREASSGGSMNSERESSECWIGEEFTTENTEGTEEGAKGIEANPSRREGCVDWCVPFKNPKSKSQILRGGIQNAFSVSSVVKLLSARACGQTRRPIQMIRPDELTPSLASIARHAR